MAELIRVREMDVPLTLHPAEESFYADHVVRRDVPGGWGLLAIQLNPFDDRVQQVVQLVFDADNGARFLAALGRALGQEPILRPLTLAELSPKFSRVDAVRTFKVTGALVAVSDHGAALDFYDVTPMQQQAATELKDEERLTIEAVIRVEVLPGRLGHLLTRDAP